jgi:hypothetical protein
MSSVTQPPPVPVETKKANGMSAPVIATPIPSTPAFQIVKVRKPDGTIVKVKRPITRAVPNGVPTAKPAATQDMTPKKTDETSQTDSKPVPALVAVQEKTPSSSTAVEPTSNKVSIPNQSGDITKVPAASTAPKAEPVIANQTSAKEAPSTKASAAVDAGPSKSQPALSSSKVPTQVPTKSGIVSPSTAIPKAGSPKPSGKAPSNEMLVLAPPKGGSDALKAVPAPSPLPPGDTFQSAGPTTTAPKSTDGPKTAFKSGDNATKTKWYEKGGKGMSSLSHTNIDKMTAVIESTANSVDALGKSFSKLGSILNKDATAAPTKKVQAPAAKPVAAPSASTSKSVPAANSSAYSVSATSVKPPSSIPPTPATEVLGSPSNRRLPYTMSHFSAKL